MDNTNSFDDDLLFFDDEIVDLLDELRFNLILAHDEEEDKKYYSEICDVCLLKSALRVHIRMLEKHIKEKTEKEIKR